MNSKQPTVSAQEDTHMTDLHHDSDSNGDTGNGTPRWVYVFGIIVIVLVLGFVILHLTGNNLGGHTPP